MTTINEQPTAPPTGDSVVRLEGVTRHAGDTTLLHPTTLSVRRGEIVGIAGGSGAGKTTLLETMAGVHTPSTGRVDRRVGSAFVPQDDIIHLEMGLRRTLLHVAALRVAGLDASARADAVDRVLARVDLTDQADVRVGDLSGGQRKRASLASEMLTDPELFFLDEATSGLDPANASELMRSLRTLTDAGSTVVLSTHSPADLARCDRIVFVGRGGHVRFVGTPNEAKAHFRVDALADVYEQLNDPAQWTAPPTAERPYVARATDATGPEVIAVEAAEPTSPSGGRQLIGLIRRNVDLIRSNRLTLAILIGSPVFITSMMAALFPSGAFDSDAGSAAMAIQILFWMAFNSFFFGLTYGLLQVVNEFEIVRREARAGLCIDAYVGSKFAVLVPMLAVVNAAQLLAMEAAGRIPDLSAGEWFGVFTPLHLLSMAAVAIGLHASSAVQTSSQATLALPMLCFPQVLFAGAVVPVSEMGWLAEAMSFPLAVRWGFEPVGRVLDLGPAASQEAGTAGFAETFTGSPATGAIVLGIMAGVGLAATSRTLMRRTAAG